MSEPTDPSREAASSPWLTSLLASTRDNAVLLISIDGVIVEWLGASALLFGYTASEAVGQPFSLIFNENDVAGGLDVQERAVAITAGRSEDDRWHRRKDGSLFWGSGIMEPLRDAAGNIVVLAKLLRDRTDVRNQVVALQSRLAVAHADRTAQLDKLAALAHELRNQVSPLSNLLSALEQSDVAPALTQPMRRQLHGLARLLDDLTQESAGEARSKRLRVARLEVQSLIRHAARALQAQVAARGQTLNLTLPQVPILFDGDGSRIDQVLINLLTNASKYTPPGGSILISATVEDDKVVIRCVDDGDGISGEVLPRIFELFTRERRDGAPDGFGIGLAVVRDIVERHGGFVEARSPGLGQGSVFTVRLPLVQPPP